jgi:hypothetical protein
LTGMPQSRSCVSPECRRDGELSAERKIHLDLQCADRIPLLHTGVWAERPPLCGNNIERRIFLCDYMQDHGKKNIG